MAATHAKAASRIFNYPDVNYLSHLTDLEHNCRRFAPAAADRMSELQSRLAPLSAEELGELYTRTFDLAPACAPYLSVHLFGESSFKRARLMTGLAELYAAKAIASDGELPDHVGVLLGALERLDPLDQQELLTHCLKTGLEKMRAELARQDNPYALAILALEQLVAAWISNTEVTSD